MTTVDVELSLVKRFRTLCERFDTRPAMARRNTLPTLIRFLGSKEREIRRLALESINLLAQHPDNLHLLNTATGLNDGVFTLFREAEYDDPILYELANDTLGLLASTEMEASESDHMTENNLSSRCSSEESENDNRDVHSRSGSSSNSSTNIVDNNIKNDNNSSGRSNHRCPDSISKQNALSAEHLVDEVNNREYEVTTQENSNKSRTDVLKRNSSIDNHSQSTYKNIISGGSVNDNSVSKDAKQNVKRNTRSLTTEVSPDLVVNDDDDHDHDEEVLLKSLRKSDVINTSSDNTNKKENKDNSESSTKGVETDVTSKTYNKKSNKSVSDVLGNIDTTKGTKKTSSKHKAFKSNASISINDNKDNNKDNNDTIISHVNISPIKKSQSREQSYSTSCELQNLINANTLIKHAQGKNESNADFVIAIEDGHVSNDKSRNECNDDSNTKHKRNVNIDKSSSKKTIGENTATSSYQKNSTGTGGNSSNVSRTSKQVTNLHNLENATSSKVKTKELRSLRLPARSAEHRSTARTPCVVTLLIPSFNSRVSGAVSAKIENVLLATRGVVSYTLLAGAHQVRIFLSDHVQDSVQAALRRAGIDNKIVEVENLPVFGARDGSVSRLSDASYADNNSFATRRSKFSFQSCKRQNEKSFFDSEQRKPTYVEQAKTFASSMYSALMVYRTPQAHTLAERVNRKRKVDANNPHSATAERVIKAFTNWW